MPLTNDERYSLTIQRRNHHLRTYAIAARIGVAVNTLWSWEAGIRTPNPDHLAAWRRVLQNVPGDTPPTQN